MSRSGCFDIMKRMAASAPGIQNMTQILNGSAPVMAPGQVTNHMLQNNMSNIPSTSAGLPNMMNHTGAQVGNMNAHQTELQKSKDGVKDPLESSEDEIVDELHKLVVDTKDDEMPP